MSKLKQTRQDRLKRLKTCCCPVHGIPMAQVGNVRALYLAECPRKDCVIQGTTPEFDQFNGNIYGSITLLPRFRHLLDVKPGYDHKLANSWRHHQHLAQYRKFLESWQPQTMH